MTLDLQAVPKYIQELHKYLSNRGSARVYKDTLEVLLKSDTFEVFHDKITSAEEKIKKLDFDKRPFDISVRISYKIKNQVFTGHGATVDEALNEVNNSFPYRMSKAVEQSYTARIRYPLDKIMEKYYYEMKEKFEEDIKKNENNIYAHYRLGDALISLGKLSEAEKEFREIIKLNPNPLVAYIAYFKLGNCLFGLKRHKEAIKEFKKAAKLRNTSEIHSSIGACLDDLGKYDEAIKEFKKAIKLHPKSAATYHTLGNYLVSFGRYEEAIKEYKKAIELNPKDAMARHNYARCFCKLGMCEKAIEELKKTIELNKDNAFTHFFLGDVLTDLKRYDEATKELNKAVVFALDKSEAEQYKSYIKLINESKENDEVIKPDKK